MIKKKIRKWQAIMWDLCGIIPHTLEGFHTEQKVIKDLTIYELAQLKKIFRLKKRLKKLTTS